MIKNLRKVSIEKYPECCAICGNLYFDTYEDSILRCDVAGDKEEYRLDFDTRCDKFELKKIQ